MAHVESHHDHSYKAGQKVRFEGSAVDSTVSGSMDVHIVDPHSNRYEVAKIEGKGKKARAYDKHGHSHLPKALVERPEQKTLSGEIRPAKRFEVHHHTLRATTQHSEQQDDLAEYDSTKDPFAHVPATIAVAGPVIYPPIAMRTVEEDTEQFDENSETHHAFKKTYPNTTHAHGRYSGDDHERFHALVMKHGGDVFDNNRFAIPHDKLKTFHAFAVSHKYKMNRQSSQHSEEDDGEQFSEHDHLYEMAISHAKKQTYNKPTADQVHQISQDLWFNNHKVQAAHPSKGKVRGHKAFADAVKAHFEANHSSQHSEEDAEQFAELPHHALLESHGWKDTGKSYGSLSGYNHSKKYLHKKADGVIEHWRNGSWEHAHAGKIVKEGSGKHDLQTYLKSIR